MKINVFGYYSNVICCPTTKVPLKAKTSRLYFKFARSDFGKNIYESTFDKNQIPNTWAL
jgi:hypothetical protein